MRQLLWLQRHAAAVHRKAGSVCDPYGFPVQLLIELPRQSLFSVVFQVRGKSVEVLHFQVHPGLESG